MTHEKLMEMLQYGVTEPVTIRIETPGWKKSFYGRVSEIRDFMDDRYVIFRYDGKDNTMNIPLAIIVDVQPGDHTKVEKISAALHAKETQKMLRNEQLEMAKTQDVSIELRHGFKNEGRVTGQVTYYGDGEVYFRANEAGKGIIILEQDHIESISPLGQ